MLQAERMLIMPEPSWLQLPAQLGRSASLCCRPTRMFSVTWHASYNILRCRLVSDFSLHQLWFQGVLAVYIKMTGKKVDKGNDLKELLMLCSIDACKLCL